MKTNKHFRSYLAQIFLEREILQTKDIKELKTHIQCSITLFQKSFPLWDNKKKKIFVDRGRPQMTIWSIRIASIMYIPMATTHPQNIVIFIALPL